MGLRDHTFPETRSSADSALGYRIPPLWGSGIRQFYSRSFHRRKGILETFQLFIKIAFPNAKPGFAAPWPVCNWLLRRSDSSWNSRFFGGERMNFRFCFCIDFGVEGHCDRKFF